MKLMHGKVLGSCFEIVWKVRFKFFFPLNLHMRHEMTNNFEEMTNLLKNHFKKISKIV